MKFVSENAVYKLARRVVKGGFKRVAIQCPDNLLHEAPDIVSTLEREVELLLYREGSKGEASPGPIFVVLADTASGNACCVDHNAAEHYVADCIVHLGTSCQILPGRTTPVLYCFPEANFSLNAFERAITRFKEERSRAAQNWSGRSLLLLYDVEYHHCLMSIVNTLRSHFSLSIYVAMARTEAFPKRQEPHTGDGARHSGCILGRDIYKVVEPTDQDKNERLVRCGSELPPYWLWSFSQEMKDCIMFYVGDTNLEETHLFRRFILRFGYSCTTWLYNPYGGVDKEDNTKILYGDPVENSSYLKPLSRLLMIRYTSIDSIQSARIIGVIFIAVGGQHHLAMFNHLKTLCRAHDKSVVSLLIGKLNVAKLENLPEIDVFCIVGCPQSTFVPEFRAYSKPLVSPFELQVALGAREWSTEYITEYEELLGTTSDINLSNNTKNHGLREDGHRADGESTQGCNHHNTQDPIVRVTDSERVQTTTKSNELYKAIPSLFPISKRQFQGVPLDVPKEHTTAVVYEGLEGIASQYTKELDTTGPVTPVPLTP